MSNKAWSGKTGGTHWMQRCLIMMFRLINPIVLYPVMCFWVLGYIIAGYHGRKGIYYYWHQRLGYSRLAAIWHLYLNYLEFGKAILDRFAAWAGRRVNVRIENQEILNELHSRPQGFILLSSHIGNQELAGYNFPMQKNMYVLTYMGDTKVVNENREAAFAKMGLKIIPYQEDGSHIFEMHKVLDSGNLLSIHGDRMFDGGRVLRTEILGQTASFPEGSFRVAAMERVPVVSLFMMREKKDTYVLYVKQLSDGKYEGHDSKQQATAILQAYVKSMESILEKYPHQWFHFYEFWKQ